MPINLSYKVKFFSLNLKISVALKLIVICLLGNLQIRHGLVSGLLILDLSLNMVSDYFTCPILPLDAVDAVASTLKW